MCVGYWDCMLVRVPMTGFNVDGGLGPNALTKVPHDSV